MRSSHTLDRVDVAFDDDHLVADAGLLLPATLVVNAALEAPAWWPLRDHWDAVSIGPNGPAEVPDGQVDSVGATAHAPTRSRLRDRAVDPSIHIRQRDLER